MCNAVEIVLDHNVDLCQFSLASNNVITVRKQKQKQKQILVLHKHLDNVNWKL